MSIDIITVPADESQPSTVTTSEGDTDALAAIIGHPVKAIEAEGLRIWVDTAIAAQPSTLNPRATKLAHSIGALGLQDCINGTAIVTGIPAETNSGADQAPGVRARRPVGTDPRATHGPTGPRATMLARPHQPRSQTTGCTLHLTHVGLYMYGGTA